MIARLIKERDEARALASNLRANGSASATGTDSVLNKVVIVVEQPTADSMDVESGLREEIKNRLVATSQEYAS